MDQKIYITPGTDKGVLQILEGAAPKQINDIHYSLQGAITCVRDFLSKSTQVYLEYDPIVKVDMSDSTIQYVSNTINDGQTITVKGKLIVHHVLRELHINNSNKIYTLNDLKRLLKQNRRIFSDKDKHLALLSNLTNFKASVQKHMEDANDSKGNITNNYTQQLQHEYNLTFELITPIYEGYPEKKFQVEINVEVREKAIEFWLESIELYEILQDDKEQIMGENILDIITKHPDMIVVHI